MASHDIQDIHDRFAEFTREMADRYALACQEKAERAIRSLSVTRAWRQGA